MVTARWDECYELVGAAGYSGEGSPTGCLLAMFSPQACTLVTSMGTQGNSALSFFLRRKHLLESVVLGADVLCLLSIEVSWSSANTSDVCVEEAKILPQMSAVGLVRAL